MEFANKEYLLLLLLLIPYIIWYVMYIVLIPLGIGIVLLLYYRYKNRKYLLSKKSI